MKCYATFEFDTNFQRETITFMLINNEDEINIHPSMFDLPINAEEDDENGVYLERINSEMYLRKYNITESDYYEYLETSGIKEFRWPSSNVHFFYSFQDIWENLSSNDIEFSTDGYESLSG